MDWRGLPSLTSLRAFEAAARHGSLTAAARELNVTHAAVAQHVRALEDRLTATLLRREGQRMAATETGRQLADALSDGFGRIEATLRDLMDRESDRPLRVALTPSFAANWLMPRIGGFWTAHPEIRLELVPASDLVDLRGGGYDIAIRYGRGGWSGVESEVLVSAGHTVVAAPSLLDEAGIKQLSDLQSQHWLLEKACRRIASGPRSTGLTCAGPA